jgi:hypothetical protein
MRELTELLLGATARIEPQYFQVMIDGGSPIYRERVYCYELYHQLRCVWPIGSEYCLNGELDKAAHPILRQVGAAYAKPDLLVHQPGCMAGNNTIIEVKSSRAQSAGIEKDLKTLALFRTEVGYQRAIYLLFGSNVEEAAERVTQTAEKISGLPAIELWLHPAPMQAAVHRGNIQRPALPAVSHSNR